MQKSNFEFKSSLEIQLRQSKEEIESLKRQIILQEQAYSKLEAKFIDYKHESMKIQNETFSKREAGDNMLTKLTDTTNISRVKILQLMHAVDDLTFKNTTLESYISRQDAESLQTNSSLLLKCQQLETLNVKLSLQDQMIDVQNEEISKLRRQLYDSQIELKTRCEKLEHTETNVQTHVNRISQLKSEVSNLKSLNYSMSKSQTEKTLSIVPSNSSSSLQTNYSHRVDKKSLARESCTVNNPDLLNNLDSSHNNSNYYNDSRTDESRFFDPNMDELDDIYDVISKEVLSRRSTTKSMPNRHAENTQIITLPQLALEIKCKTAMYPNELSRPSVQGRLLTR